MSEIIDYKQVANRLFIILKEQGIRKTKGECAFEVKRVLEALASEVRESPTKIVKVGRFDLKKVTIEAKSIPNNKPLSSRISSYISQYYIRYGEVDLAENTNKTLKDLTPQEIEECKAFILNPLTKVLPKTKKTKEQIVAVSIFMREVDRSWLRGNLIDMVTEEYLDEYVCEKTGQYPTNKQIEKLAEGEVPLSEWKKKISYINPWFGYRSNVRGRQEQHFQKTGEWLTSGRFIVDEKGKDRIIGTVVNGGGVEYIRPSKPEDLTVIKHLPKIIPHFKPERWPYPAIEMYKGDFTKILKLRNEKIQEIQGKPSDNLENL